MRWSATAAGALCGLLPIALAYGFAPQARRLAGTETAQIPAVIFTAAPVYRTSAALEGRERFPEGAHLVILRSGQMQPLVPGFAASADASVSFDAKTVLFAGKKEPRDRWQIWQVAVEGGSPRLILDGKTDLIRPLWMPDERIVYARQDASGFKLETAGLDGSGVLRLSYLPGSFIPSDVLRDGRVLFESHFPLGTDATLEFTARSEDPRAELFLVYADGSGVESVRCDHPEGMKSAGREHGHEITSGSGIGRSGDITFTQSGKLMRFTSALADAVPIVAPAGAYGGDVAELPDGRWVLSVRKPGARHFAMTLWRPGTASLTQIAQVAERDLVEPVVVAPRAVPNRHPSALHEWTYGNLLALDARQSRGGDLAPAPATVRAETLNEAGHAVVVGTAPVEKDGSFFVQAAGDRPLRFILLDAAGHPLRAEHGWFWMRRGEQRICVGCHTGPERAPENRVPLVLLHTTTPVDVTGGPAAATKGGH